jgi:putative membrane protein
MKKLELVFVAIVALLHFYFMVLEMFLWTTPKGLETFHMTQEVANSSATLAANQGLYNGFLAAGLVLSLIYASKEGSLLLRRFVLVCVVLAGAYGAYTVGIKILFVQALPASLALVFGFLSKPSNSEI